MDKFQKVMNEITCIIYEVEDRVMFFFVSKFQYALEFERRLTEKQNELEKIKYFYFSPEKIEKNILKTRKKIFQKLKFLQFMKELSKTLKKIPKKRESKIKEEKNILSLMKKINCFKNTLWQKMVKIYRTMNYENSNRSLNICFIKDFSESFFFYSFKLYIDYLIDFKSNFNKIDSNGLRFFCIYMDQINFFYQFSIKYNILLAKRFQIFKKNKKIPLLDDIFDFITNFHYENFKEYNFGNNIFCIFRVILVFYKILKENIYYEE